MAGEPRSKSSSHECPFRDVVIPKEPDGNLEGRVGFLEGAVKTLTDDVQQVNHSVGQLGQQLNQSVTTLGREIGSLRELMADKIEQVTQRMASAIESVTSRMHQETKPNWQIIIAGIALLATILIFFLSGHGGQIAELKAAQEHATEQYAKAQYEKGATDAFVKMAEARMAEFTKAIKDMDDKLQREMILINNATEARVKAMDEKLQMEIQGHTKTLEQECRDLREFVMDLKKWRLDHSEGNARVHGQIDTLLSDMQARLKLLEDRQWTYRADRLKAYDEAQLQRTPVPPLKDTK